MSYDIEVFDPATSKVIVLEQRHYLKGGTYVLGGSNEAHLNITYNYARHFKRIWGEKGIRIIYGMRVADTLPVLATALPLLGDDMVDDYWAPTEGNAKHAILDLMTLGAMCISHGLKVEPMIIGGGVWRGD